MVPSPRLALALALACGCTSSGTGVELTIEGPGLHPDQLQITASYDLGDFEQTVPANASPLTLPVTLLAALPDRAARVTFVVVAGQGGRIIARGSSAPVDVSPHAIAQAEVVLGAAGPDGGDADLAAQDLTGQDLAGADLARAPEDAGPPPDMASCSDGKKDGNESDVDCGGGACAPCAADRACLGNGDCASGICDTGRCLQATSPPAWLGGAMLTFGPTALVGAPDGKLYAFDPTKTAAYDPAADAWTEGLASKGGASRFNAAPGGDGKAYACGGTGSITSVLGYDPTANSWSAAPSLMQGRQNPAATLGPDGRIYVIGGLGASGSAESWRPGDVGWVLSAALVQHRQRAAAATGSDGRVYAIGGLDDTGTPSAAVEALVPNGAWAAVTALPGPRVDLTAAAGADGRVYAIGGSDGANDLATVWAYSPATARWNAVAALPKASPNLAAGVGTDGRIYVAFGSGDAVRSYGPRITLSSSTAMAGAQLQLSGLNFAANAAVAVSIGGSPVAGGTTDGQGGLAATSFTVPQLAAGSYRVVAEDARSAYPVSAPLTVQ